MFKIDAKFSLDVTTSKGPDVKLAGNIHTIYNADHDDKGFVEDIVDIAMARRSMLP